MADLVGKAFHRAKDVATKFSNETVTEERLANCNYIERNELC